VAWQGHGRREAYIGLSTVLTRYTYDIRTPHSMCLYTLARMTKAIATLYAQDVGMRTPFAASNARPTRNATTTKSFCLRVSQIRVNMQSRACCISSRSPDMGTSSLGPSWESRGWHELWRLVRTHPRGLWLCDEGYFEVNGLELFDSLNTRVYM
jgi:hypothetical protein